MVTFTPHIELRHNRPLRVVDWIVFLDSCSSIRFSLSLFSLFSFFYLSPSVIVVILVRAKIDNNDEIAQLPYRIDSLSHTAFIVSCSGGNRPSSKPP
jgi:hypothetical protein